MRVAAKTWRKVFERDKGYCQYCNLDLLNNFSSYWAATVDHVHAVAENGADNADNLVLSCPACNSMLSRSGALTTFAERKNFVEKRRKDEINGFENWKKTVR